MAFGMKQVSPVSYQTPNENKLGNRDISPPSVHANVLKPGNAIKPFTQQDRLAAIKRRIAQSSSDNDS